MKDDPEVLVPDVAAWSAWLEEHHAQDGGVWLVLAKKGRTVPTSLTYDAALDEALCFGWIDGQLRRRDEATTFQRFSPRRTRSVWSARNVEKVGRLLEQGRMRPAGLAAVEAAKANGRWDTAYGGAATIEVPDDLAAALAADPAASATFERLTSSNRFAILYRLQDARRPETRARRLEQYVAMLARGEALYPQKGLRNP
jgi:uncharacterized protein YdeI (YjbR/CyaY-like superfamily)